MNWWFTAMKKYVVFSGRARRAEYWMFYLFTLIFGVVAIILDNALGLANEETGYGILYVLFGLAVALPYLSVTVRRLHDVGKSGWWIFINLIPIVGSIWLFILTVTDSQPFENQYGINPKAIAY